MKNATEIVILLDRSGSMEATRKETISAFNEFVHEQQLLPGEAHLTLIQFDTKNPYEVVFDSVLAETPKLTDKTFEPRSGTPLHDAIGFTINRLGDKLSNLPESQRPDKVIVVILTDGEENASQKFHGPEIFRMVNHQRDVYNWHFVFLGAQENAVASAVEMGIPAAQAIYFSSCFDPATVGKVIRSTSANIGGLRSGIGASLNYSPEQRKEANTEANVPAETVETPKA